LPDPVRRPSCINICETGLLGAVTMNNRILNIAMVASFISLSSAIGIADAQVASALPAAAASCPRGPVSIYFAAGETTASPQAQALLGKIGETVGICQPDRIEVVARVFVDENGQDDEGDMAMSLALKRLSLVADDLMARGLPADRIHVSALAAAPGTSPGPGLHQIEILFQKDGDLPDPPTASERVVPSVKAIAI
jgi:hypothetical protein